MNASKNANTFIKLYYTDKYKETLSLDPLKLLKLCYIAHGFCLSLKNLPAIDSEDGEVVEAWKFGPVIPSIYHQTKHFGKRNIELKGKEIDKPENYPCQDTEVVKKGKEEMIKIKDSKPLSKGDNFYKIFLGVWERYKKYSSLALVGLTHRPGTPWDRYYKKGERNIIIPDEDIKLYYNFFIQSLSKVLSRDIKQDFI